MQKIDEKLIKQIFPKRDDLAHKGTYHKVLMIGGSKMMHGAIELAALSAYRSGVGTLTLMIPDAIYDIVAKRFDFAMIRTIKNDEDGFMIYDDKIKEFAANFDIIVFGNGIGRNKDTKMILKDILGLDKKVIIDADGLYYLKDIKDIKAQVIYTPHLKEMSYMTGLNVKNIEDDPLKAINTYIQKDPKATIILKSARSIIADKDSTYLLDNPTSKLAKGGSGDILCGIVTGMWAQGKSAIDAAILASYIHNLAAFTLDKSPLSIIPDDIIDNLDHIYQNLAK